MVVRKNFKIEQKHVDYFNSVIPELIKAEETIERIKGSYEWKRAYNYFSCLKTRGILKVKPTKENGYRLEMGEGLIDISELKGIVTEEQMEKIKELMK